eukprot:XP_001690566.1 predicted protein [Chlamydomonas reinhardtii]
MHRMLVLPTGLLPLGPRRGPASPSPATPTRSSLSVPPSTREAPTRHVFRAPRCPQFLTSILYQPELILNTHLLSLVSGTTSGTRTESCSTPHISLTATMETRLYTNGMCLA